MNYNTYKTGGRVRIGIGSPVGRIRINSRPVARGRAVVVNSPIPIIIILVIILLILISFVLIAIFSNRTVETFKQDKKKGKPNMRNISSCNSCSN